MKKYIYKITNLINSKVYIGQTKNYKNRMWNHKNRNSSVISKAIKKYGETNFSFEILAIVEQHMANETEQKAIKIYDSQIPKGYNVALGGGSGPMSDATKQKMSASRTGKKLSRAHCEAMSKCRMGKKKGPLSEETKIKMSLKTIGRTVSEETRRKISEHHQRDKSWLYKQMKLGAKRTNKSGFKGVSKHSEFGKYVARITINKKRIRIGYYQTPEEAAKAYDQMAFFLYGPDVFLNFKEDYL